MSRRTRLAAYGVCIGERGILLTRLWRHDPGAGQWTLPGGGLDFGEDPEDALVREFWEETGLEPVVGSLLTVDSRVYEPWRQRGPLHAIRFVYSVRADGEPTVIEENGSTVDVGWWPLDSVTDLPRVNLVDVGMRWVG